MSGKNSFRDPVTNVLKAWGYTLSNSPGDLVHPEEDLFNLEPGRWQWNGTTWIAFTPPLPPPNPLVAFITSALSDPAVPPSLKALLAAWKSQL